MRLNELDIFFLVSYHVFDSTLEMPCVTLSTRVYVQRRSKSVFPSTTITVTVTTTVKQGAKKVHMRKLAFESIILMLFSVTFE